VNHFQASVTNHTMRIMLAARHGSQVTGVSVAVGELARKVEPDFSLLPGKRAALLAELERMPAPQHHPRQRAPALVSTLLDSLVRFVHNKLVRSTA
jgi:hypothetical protein